MATIQRLLKSEIIVLMFFVLAGCGEPSPDIKQKNVVPEELNLPGTGSIAMSDIENAKGILLKFESTVSIFDQQRLLNDYSLQQKNRFTVVSGLVYAEFENQESAEGLRSTLLDLNAEESIAYAEPDFSIFLNENTESKANSKTIAGYNAGLSQRQLSANNIANGQSAIQSVAMLDTGIDYNHAKLSNNIWANVGEIPLNGIDDDGNGWVDDIYGWNFVEDDNNPKDFHQHGTQIAGVISGTAEDNQYVNDSNIKLLAVRVLDEHGEGKISYVLQALEYIIANNIKFSNIGWSVKYHSKALFNALQAMNKYDHLFLIAAGDDSQNLDQTQKYPASYKMDNILSVASLTNTGSLSDFSNYSKISIELAAPGENINSIVNNDEDELLTLSGTRMAVAVATNFALKLKLENNLLTGKELKSLIIDKASQLDLLNNKVKLNKALIANLEIASNADENDGSTDSTASVLISSAVSDIAVGESIQLTIEGGVPPYNWVAKNALFADVDENGLLKGVTAGSTGITATDSTGTQSNELVFNVTPMMINSDQAKLISIDQKATFTAKGGVPPFQWRINDETIASGIVKVDDSSIFIVTPILPGEIDISLEDAFGNLATLSMFIAEGLPLVVNPPALSMTLNQTKQLHASGGTSPYNWSSSDKTVASVNDVGMVTGLAAGDANIIVTDSAANIQTIAVSVNPALTISANRTIFSPGDSPQLTALGGEAPYQWSSSDSSIISFNENDQITAESVGFADIVVEDNTLASGSITLEVRELNIDSPTTVARVGSGPIQLNVNGGVNPFNWTVNDSAIATISSTGLLEPVGVGEVNIKVTDADGFSASLLLTIEPTSLSINISNAVLAVDDVLPLIVSGGDGNYSWSNTDNTVVSVDTTGRVTALAGGSSVITVSDGLGQFLEINISVSTIGIKAAKTTLMITEPGLQLSVTGGTGPFSWNVDDMNIANIDQNGFLTPINTGNVLVSASDGNGLSVSINITVDAMPVSIFAEKLILGLPDSAVLTAIGGDGNYTWQSNDESIIVVDSSGVAQAITTGVAEIIVTDGIGQIASVSLEVRELLLSESAISLVVGDPALSLSVSGGATPYSWSSSDTNIVTVSNSGLAVAQSAGIATITVVDADGFTANSDVSVSFMPLLMNQQNLLMAINDSQQLTVSGGNNQFTWSSTDSNVVSVNSNGDITALSAGIAIITVSDTIGAQDSITVEVRKITIAAGKTILSLGESDIPLVAAGGSSPYTWTSSDSAIVSVSSTGIISGNKAGSATITVSDVDGFSENISITVEPSTLIVANNAIVLGIGNTQIINVSGGDNNYSWSSSNNNIATVNNTGMLTGIANGAATITITDGLNQSVTVSVQVRSLSISPSSSNIDITVGALQLSASGGNGSYSWSSNNSSIATINNIGLLTVVDIGAVTITAMDSDGISGSKTLNISATNVTLNKASDLIAINDSSQLSASGGDENFSWSSSNINVATVNNSGWVTGQSAGSVTITVTDGLGQTATANIEVRQVRVSAASSSVDIGNTIQISASGGNAPYSFSVSNNNASINNAGLLTANNSGSLTVTATDSDGFSASLSITITVPPLSINRSSALLGIGGTTQLSANGGDGNYNWNSSNPGVASVNSSGFVTANSAGSAIITLSDNSGNNLTANIEVREVRVSAASSSVDIGNTIQISASGGNAPYSFSVSNNNASINNSGLLTANNSGSLTVTATDSDGFSASLSITITVPPLSINRSSALLGIGGTTQLSANGGDGNYNWNSSNTAVASVNSSGFVTANSAGSAVITLSDNSGNNITANIEVREVTLSATTTTITVGNPALQVNASGGNTPYTWSSSNSAVATVNSIGQVTAVTAGSVTIQASDADGFRASISITVNSAPNGGGGRH